MARDDLTGDNCYFAKNWNIKATRLLNCFHKEKKYCLLFQNGPFLGHVFSY